MHQLIQGCIQHLAQLQQGKHIGDRLPPFPFTDGFIRIIQLIRQLQLCQAGSAAKLRNILSNFDLLLFLIHIFLRKLFHTQ